MDAPKGIMLMNYFQNFLQENEKAIDFFYIFLYFSLKWYKFFSKMIH